MEFTTRVLVSSCIMLMVGIICPRMPVTWAEEQQVVYDGFKGPGAGKHIVFVTGDEEYRSEEAMAQIAKILAIHHGFKCSVLFAMDNKTGQINPIILNNIAGLEALDRADLMVLFTRFRELPDEQMKYIIDYTNSGKPIIGVRTSTHAFLYRKNRESPYFKYGSGTREFKGGFGRQVLGETWVAHHGKHGWESTRGVIAEGKKDHPIVRGCEDIWGTTDVYKINTLSGDSDPVVMGRVLKGMAPDSPPNIDKEQMPIAWIKTYTGEKGKKARVFTTTMGAATDFKSEGLRRLLVNACYWCLEMENKIPDRAKVDLVGKYQPSNFGFGKFKKGMKPSDYRISVDDLRGRSGSKEEGGVLRVSGG